ncbi:MAG: sigma-70 family RNA polymerase sigma factor [Planctomycetes bacterium]|nr:sigma-70 family RNA polymerase sigma factor [Planctomycetota bacterium]
MHSDPDSKLILACQASPMTGLEGPFRELYELYKDRVYNVCYRISGNPSDALDAAQETFGILFRKLREFRFESKFSSWVYRIAVNAAIDLRRRNSSRKLTSLDALQDTRDTGSRVPARFDPADERIEMPIHAASRHELEREVQRAIQRLSPKLRAITVLRYIENLSYEQIAETLQISIGTVKSRLARAHDMLDRELTPVLDRYYLG